jgi:hypothetical protein
MCIPTVGKVISQALTYGLDLYFFGNGGFQIEGSDEHIGSHRSMEFIKGFRLKAFSIYLPTI